MDMDDDGTDIIYRDRSGQLRKFGLLPSDPQRVMAAFPRSFESEFKVWSDSDLKIAAEDPNRKCGRNIFSSKCIQNQGSKGSCAGYAAAQILAKCNSLRDPANAGDANYVKLSGAYAYSLCNGGRDSGSMLIDNFNVIIENGIPPESLCPWDQIYPRLQRPGLAAEAAKLKGWQGLRLNSWEGLLTLIAMGGVVATCVMAGPRYETLDSDGVAGVDNGSGNHANHADDFRWRPTGFQVDNVNQWGTGYGDQGRAWMTYASFRQTMKVHQHYGFLSTVRAD